jgi:hypothetical protein
MTGILKVDTIQKNDGSVPTAADLGLNVAGAVLQVVQNSTSTAVSTTATDWTDSGLSASITPSSTSSKILVLVSQVLTMGSSSDNQQQSNLGIFNSSNTLLFGQSGYDQLRIKPMQAFSWPVDMKYLHSPNTTSEYTYKTRMRIQQTNGTTLYAQNSSQPSTITLLEIAG